MTREEFLILEQKCNAIRQRATEAGKRAQLDPPPSEPLTSVMRGSTAAESEAALHDEIIKVCKQNGFLYFHGAMGTRTSRTEGEPDFTIFLPMGRVCFVECKTKTGKLSPAQQAVHHHAESLGHSFHVVRSLADFMALMISENTVGFAGTQSVPQYASKPIPSLQPHLIMQNPAAQPVKTYWNGQFNPQLLPSAYASFAPHNADRFKGLTATEISEVLRRRNADSMLDDVCADPAELMQRLDEMKSAVLKGEMKAIGDLPKPAKYKTSELLTPDKDVNTPTP